MIHTTLLPQHDYSVDSTATGAGTGAADFGNTSLSSPSVTFADTITSSSLISRKKSAPSTTYPKLWFWSVRKIENE